jgi:hypothetical protein
MSINRPDRPLRGAEGSRSDGRRHDHPERGAAAQERGDGAHAEYVDTTDAGAADDHGGPVPDPATDGAPEVTGPGSPRSDRADDAGAPRPGARPAVVGLALLLVVVAAILVAMVSGVFIVTA